MVDARTLKRRYDERARQRSAPDVPAMTARLDSMLSEIEDVEMSTTQLEKRYEELLASAQREQAAQERAERRYWRTYAMMRVAGRGLVFGGWILIACIPVVLLFGLTPAGLVLWMVFALNCLVALMVFAEDRIEAQKGER